MKLRWRDLPKWQDQEIVTGCQDAFANGTPVDQARCQTSVISELDPGMQARRILDVEIDNQHA